MLCVRSFCKKYVCNFKLKLLLVEFEMNKLLSVLILNIYVVN